jgi:hypothetical protein
MKTYESMLNNILSLTVDKEEAISEFDSYRKFGIGLSVGFMEERLVFDLPTNSKELKLLSRIKIESYEYHTIDNDLEYVHRSNEYR